MTRTHFRTSSKAFALAAAVVGLGAAHAETKERGLQFHAGLETGLQILSTNVANEIDKKGFFLTPKFGALWLKKEWEWEADLGLRYSQISGSSGNVEKKISFLTGWFELAPRYRVSRAFSIGPTLDLLFGTDTSHTETAQAGSKLTMLFGASSRLAFEDAPLSLTGRITMDANLANQLLLNFGVGLLWHFGGEETYEPIREAAPPLPVEEPLPPPPAPTPAPRRAEVQVERDNVLLRIPENVLLFDTAMSHLKENQKRYLQRVGEVLWRYEARWKRLEVTGHTDYRGTDAVNQELSEARARSVSHELVAAGVDATRLLAVGRGESQPLTMEKDPESLSRNRRVEIRVEGIERGADLAAELGQITLE